METRATEGANSNPVLRSGLGRRCSVGIMSFWISSGKSAYVDRFEDALDDEQPGRM
jgi:hypothetical protein